MNPTAWDKVRTEVWVDNRAARRARDQRREREQRSQRRSRARIERALSQYQKEQS